MLEPSSISKVLSLDVAGVHFSIFNILLNFSVDFGITGCYNPCRLYHADSQNTHLFSYVFISTFI